MGFAVIVMQLDEICPLLNLDGYLQGRSNYRLLAGRKSDLKARLLLRLLFSEWSKCTASRKSNLNDLQKLWSASRGTYDLKIANQSKQVE